jgi:threonine synthase
MYYKSTRGVNNKKQSSYAIIKGIASDGGLFVPENFPALDRSFKSLLGLCYRDIALYVIGRFFTDFTEKELKYCIGSAYDEKFDDSEIAPLVEKENVFFLELFHGPTLAFKDMALSILPHLLKVSMSKIGLNKEIVILTATSGDTGKAALEGFANVEGMKIIVFYPYGGVSAIQERHMITQEGENTYVVGVKGDFDDTQRGVKEIFSDSSFNLVINKKGYVFSSANSINIGRLIPQVVYYINSYLKLISSGKIEPGEPVNIVVPTGNFGNILAAYYSKKMGLPLNKLICASNENNVLYDFIRTGTYNRKRKLIPTSSPAMDILVSSNLERLLYDISENDSDIINKLMDDLGKKGEFKITGKMKGKMADFYGGFATDEETFKTIKDLFSSISYLIDTHTAVGYNVYQKYLKDSGDRTKTIIVSTANPFKFPGSLCSALDEKYKGMDEFALLPVLSGMTGLKIPETIKRLGGKEILHTAVCGPEEMKDVISDILGL